MLLKALVDLGFAEIDAEIYLFLAKAGPQNGRNIAKMLKLYKPQLYRRLKRLQTKGVICATCARPAQFSAVSLEKVLDLMIETKKEQVLAWQESKKALLATWCSLIEKWSPSN
jgi:sugar-specific transcriptional regulator TrmB